MLRAQGYSYADIAERLEYRDQSAARASVSAALYWTLREPAEEVRMLELDRLDQLLVKLQPRLNQGELAAMDRALSISKRRAELLGLDVFKPVAVLNIDMGSLTEEQLERIAGGEDPMIVLGAMGPAVLPGAV
jgi:hypothetical protein